MHFLLLPVSMEVRGERKKERKKEEDARMASPAFVTIDLSDHAKIYCVYS